MLQAQNVGKRAGTEEVLMVVKTYPNPSSHYGELVCTAGIRMRDGEWVRIYPYPFRQVPEQHRFSKYDIISAPLELPREHDPRPESYRLSDPRGVKQIGHLDTKGNWAARLRHILPTVMPSVGAFQKAMFPDATRWGASIRPVQIDPSTAAFSYKYRGKDWDAETLEKLRKAEMRVKGGLFVDQEVAEHYQILRRVPYEFRLRFKDLTDSEYDLIILDWELAQLYFNCRRRTTSDEAAIEMVRFKVEEQICSPRNDVYLVLGNMHHRFRNPNNIAIDGFIYPQKQVQARLF